MWPFVSAEQWAAWIASQGYDPTQFTFGDPGTAVEPITCSICSGEFSPDKLYLLVDPPPGVPYGRKYHADCIIQHMNEHGDDLTDEVLNYALRKRTI